MQHFTSFFLDFKPNVLVRKALFLLNAAFAMAILELTSPAIPVHKQYRPLVS